MTKNFLVLILLIFNSHGVHAQSVLEENELKSFAGFFDFHYSESKDKIYLEVNHLDSSFLYVSSLSEGIGSNDLFLDRGQLGGTRVVKFIKAGNKLLLIQPNLEYRAITSNPLEKKSVKEAFAKSVLFGFPIVEKTKDGYLIDITPFLLMDTHGVINILKDKKQGTYTVDSSRSALNMERTKSFANNVDFDAIITLKGLPIAKEIKSVTPNPELVTVYQHHSFVKLPDDKFIPRKYHPNSGSFYTSFMNYSAPINKTMEVRYSWRHRLEKKNPEASISEAVKPIIYYLDNGTPEPVRTALLEGASWWNEAFESIGFKDAFQVRMLPDTIDPLDVRYNVIQWVHRSTRGWSYGGGVIDPRTGEIIKGHVSLGSLRVRQDYMIAQALSNMPFGTGNDMTDKLLEFALARIRQLSAHEVGHTLGFSHNFAASRNNRASVMDYPHPLVNIENNNIDLSEAYAKGIGEWDKITVAYSYSQFEDNEEAELSNIIKTAMDQGFKFVSDADARPKGSANVDGHLWDNGPDSVTELINIIAVRQKAIAQFGSNNIKDGESFDKLEDLFVLLYFFHRYQTEATIKSIGGLEYGYRLKGDVDSPTKPVSTDKQYDALNAVLKTIDANFLAIPKDKLNLFPARGPGQRDRESFNTLTGPSFDPFSAAATGADHTLDILLNEQRCARLIIQKSIDSQQLGLSELLDLLIFQTFKVSYEDNYINGIQSSINTVVLNLLINLAKSPNSLRQIKDITDEKLSGYLTYLKNLGNKTVSQKGHIQTIELYFKDPDKVPVLKVPNIPDGSPIGSNTCSHG